MVYTEHNKLFGAGEWLSSRPLFVAEIISIASEIVHVILFFYAVDNSNNNN